MITVSSQEAQFEVSQDEDTIDLRDLAKKVWKGRWWIALCVLVFGGAAAAYAFTTPRIYRSSVVLVPADGAQGGLEAALGQLGGLASLAGIQVGGANSLKQEALAVLRSREFTEAFIRDKDIMPLLFSKKWDKNAQSWKVGVKAPTAAQANKYFAEHVRSVVEDRKTNLVTLHIDWRDREQAAEWANEMVERLNAEMQRRAAVAAEASVGYLEKELVTTTPVATRDAIHRLIEAQIKQRMLANVTREYAFRVVDRAMPADENDPIRPRRVLLLVGGVVVGGAIGIFLVLGLGALSTVSRPNASKS